MTGAQYERLSTFLRQDFTFSMLRRLLKFRLDRDIEDISLGDDKQEVIFAVIDTANREGWWDQLIGAARASRPRNAALAVLAEELGLSCMDSGTARALESIVREHSKYRDISRFREDLGLREGQVCRIEYPFDDGAGKGEARGTGFLVGSSLVMTARHVMAAAIGGSLSGDRIACRFDYKVLPNGKTNDGTVYTLAKPSADWRVADRPHGAPDTTGAGELGPTELDYAVLRLDKAAGDDVVGLGDAKGGGAAEEGAAKRGWMTLYDTPPSVGKGLDLYLIQHPATKAMKFGSGRVEGLEFGGRRLKHDVPTEPGSSGSPCMTIDLDVVAVHHAGDAIYGELKTETYNRAVPLELIIADLRNREDVHVDRFWEEGAPPTGE